MRAINTNYLENLTNLKIIHELGHGMFSYVYDAVDPNSREVAVKCLQQDEPHEVEALKSCQDCPYIIKLYDYHTFDPTLSILVQENFVSVPFNNYSYKLNIPLLKNLARMMLTALQTIHAHGFVHCDFKLDNILISPSLDDIRVIDFGCARKVSSRMPINNGTRSYRPPEQLLGWTRYNEKADIWAFGLDMYNITVSKIDPWDASRAVYQAANMSQTFGKDKIIRLMDDLGIPKNPEILAKMSNQLTKPFDEMLNNVHPQFMDEQLVDFIKSALVLDPRRRPSANELLNHPFLQSD